MRIATTISVDKAGKSKIVAGPEVDEIGRANV